MSQKKAKKLRKEEAKRNQPNVPEQTSNISEEANEIRDLEEMLNSSDIDGYAQTCWTLANNIPHTPYLGQIVTRSGPCEEHGFHEYEFKLTLKSMMTITQCTGMKTCGEAIKLVASKLSPERLPCYPHGHEDQFKNLFMFGIKPHECIYCGETPNFAGSAKSIDWDKEILTKGVDGQEYRACPNCNSDMLEIQGENLNQWGWMIKCDNCDWEIKQVEPLDIPQYLNLMERTKKDIDEAITLMESQTINIETRVRIVGTQTRRILENIAFAALISNKDAWDKSPEEMEEMWNPREILKELEKAHPDFFPKPINVRTPKKGKDRPFTIKTKGVITRHKLIQIYKELSPLAHSQNPMAKPIDDEYFKVKIPIWLNEIIETLTMHQITLPHHPDQIYVVKLEGHKETSVHCIPLTKNSDNSITCAWPECVSNRHRLHCEIWETSWEECTLTEKEPDQTEAKMACSMIDDEVAKEKLQELLAEAGHRDVSYFQKNHQKP